MGRHRGPVERLSRRGGVELELKGKRLLAGKSALERRPYPHGRGRVRASEYAAQLREKQNAKRYYGPSERQFRGTHARSGGGAELLRSLELRLDNVLSLPARPRGHPRSGTPVHRARSPARERAQDRPALLPRARSDLVALSPGSAG